MSSVPQCTEICAFSGHLLSHKTLNLAPRPQVDLAAAKTSQNRILVFFRNAKCLCLETSSKKLDNFFPW